MNLARRSFRCSAKPCCSIIWTTSTPRWARSEPPSNPIREKGIGRRSAGLLNAACFAPVASSPGPAHPRIKIPPLRRRPEAGDLRMEKNNNAEKAGQSRVAGPRHSILDLAPLELECLSVLWPMGEGTVRDIHRALSASRPRAYTTVMTIMDRLEQKGIVARRKVGRAFHYQARLSAEDARLKAVEKIVEGFFDGSAQALAAHLSALASQGSAVREFAAPTA